VNDPFWQTHTPPWDWGCRCWLTQVSSADYARIKSGKGYGRVLGPAEHKRLNLTGELDDGAGHVITITTPAQRAAQNGEDPKLAWHWNPGDLRIPLDALHARYGADPETWHSFQDFAENNELIFGNLRHSLWDEMLDPERAKARAEVLAYGSKTGGEMAVAINYETGARVGFAVSAPGNKYEVDTSKLVATARSQKIKISLAHNHLSGNTFSPADISNLANPEVVEVLAHTQWARYRMARLVDMKPENAKRFSALMKQWTGDLKSGKKSWEEWVKYLQGSTIRGVMKYEAILVN
jgi:hypothetical protein